MIFGNWLFSLHQELKQLQSATAPCGGLTASEWSSYLVELEEGYARQNKELREKTVESGELRLINQGLEKAHATVVNALDDLQLSHAAVLLDRDRLMSVFKSEIQDGLEEHDDELNSAYDN